MSSQQRCREMKYIKNLLKIYKKNKNDHKLFNKILNSIKTL